MRVVEREDTDARSFRAAIVVSLRLRGQTQDMAESCVRELEQLAATLGFRVVARFYQRLDRPRSTTFIGRGKIAEIATCLKKYPDAVLLFDDDLSPSQLRSLEKVLRAQIYDRSLLILEIFLLRAQTAQAKLQVSMARYEYLLPRLTRRWTHLERQRGGLSTRGGAGEKEIETDRRQIRHRISLLRKKLRQLEQQAVTQRKSRRKLLRCALVGYTNSGKSTLMNALTSSNVEVADKLFATLDTTVRRLKLGQQSCLLSDTVGFIRKLPHSLISSFKSTLAEAKEADLLLHVADLSHPLLQEQVETVEHTLEDIGIRGIPMLLILNKADLVSSCESEDKPTAFDRVEVLKTRYTYLCRHVGSALRSSELSTLRDTLAVQIEKLQHTCYFSRASS